jgi:hypothetical protein
MIVNIVFTSECERSCVVVNEVVSRTRKALLVQRARDLLFISCVGPPLTVFNPNSYVESWLRAGRKTADDTAYGKREPIRDVQYVGSAEVVVSTSRIAAHRPSQLCRHELITAIMILFLRTHSSGSLEDDVLQYTPSSLVVSTRPCPITLQSQNYFTTGGLPPLEDHDHRFFFK